MHTLFTGLLIPRAMLEPGKYSILEAVRSS